MDKRVADVRAWLRRRRLAEPYVSVHFGGPYDLVAWSDGDRDDWEVWAYGARGDRGAFCSDLDLAGLVVAEGLHGAPAEVGVDGEGG